MLQSIDWTFLLFTLAIAGILIHFLFKNKCPRCNSKFYYIKHLKTDDLGADFSNPNTRIQRKQYQCRKCKHTWSKDYNRSDSGDID